MLSYRAQTMFWHCVVLPLPAARLPPLSVTPGTASMPRSWFWFAVLLFNVADPTLTWIPSSPLPLARLPSITVPVAPLSIRIPVSSLLFATLCEIRLSCEGVGESSDVT